MCSHECSARSGLGTVPILLAIGVLVCSGPLATAGDLSDIYFRIDVQSSVGTAFYEVPTSDPSVGFDPVTDTWTWTTTGVSLGDVATLNQANLTIVGDPRITLGFALTAGAADTTITISSAVLSFTPMVNPDGAATAGMTLTESTGDTATLTGLGGNNGSAYVATYNTPPGTIFAEYIQYMYQPDDWASISLSDGTGGLIPIADTVSNMQAQFSFLLTAGDQASATSNFLIIPEPASFALLAACGVLVLRRRG